MSDKRKQRKKRRRVSELAVPELEVKASTIPGAGYGLFTKQDLRENAHVGFYTGRVVHADVIDPKNPYIFGIESSTGRCIDPSLDDTNKIKYANDLFEDQQLDLGLELNLRPLYCNRSERLRFVT